MKRDDDGRIGILLLNLGGPDTLDAVRPFLLNLFRDRDIIRLPGGRVGQAILSRIIVYARLRRVKRAYARIGGGSPILDLTTRQARALEADLINRGTPAVVRIAMRYWHPFTVEALEEFSRLGVRRIVALTLYPHYSTATTGSSLSELDSVIAREYPGEFDVSYITEWPELPGYLDALAGKVEKALQELAPEIRQSTVLLFSAHGLPVDFITQGDPYVAHIEQTCAGVLQRLTAEYSWRLAYQSRTGPVEWLSPATSDTIRQLAANGVRDVVIIPVSFVTDHIETLEEIDIQFAELAHGLRLRTFKRVEALNDDSVFISALGELVMDQINEQS